MIQIPLLKTLNVICDENGKGSYIHFDDFGGIVKSEVHRKDNLNRQFSKSLKKIDIHDCIPVLSFLQYIFNNSKYKICQEICHQIQQKIGLVAHEFTPGLLH